MKICVVGDVHFSQYSSIVRKRGERFSVRLENCINSVNWAERYAVENNCDFMVYLGDFFDKPDLNSEEISALQNIEWNGLFKYFICGNHEMGRSDLSYNSANALNMSYSMVVNEVKEFDLGNNICVSLLPYTLNSNECHLDDILKAKTATKIVFSHNDIAGIQMGSYLSKEGFNIQDIEDNCDLFINGHLHNGIYITDKILNLGNLTGQNFSEDATKYIHNIAIIEIGPDSNEINNVRLVENPYAFNFYKVDLTDAKGSLKRKLTQLKDNAVLTIKCKESQVTEIKDYIKSIKNIVEYRLTIIPDESREIVENDLISIDHIQRFNEYILQTLGESDVVKEELQVISQ